MGIHENVHREETNILRDSTAFIHTKMAECFSQCFREFNIQRNIVATIL